MVRSVVRPAATNKATKVGVAKGKELEHLTALSSSYITTAPLV